MYSLGLTNDSLSRSEQHDLQPCWDDPGGGVHIHHHVLLAKGDRRGQTRINGGSNWTGKKPGFRGGFSRPDLCFLTQRHAYSKRMDSVSLSDGDFLIGPCRSQRLGRRQELAIGQAGPGTKGIIGKVPGPRVHPVDTRVFNPFPWKGR